MIFPRICLQIFMLPVPSIKTILILLSERDRNSNLLSIFSWSSHVLIFATCRWNHIEVVKRHRPDGKDGVSERERDAEDTHKDTRSDLLYAKSFVEAHLSGIDGGACHRSNSEHLRHTLPGNKWWCVCSFLQATISFGDTFEHNGKQKSKTQKHEKLKR